MSNKSDGTAFEQRMANILFEHGFWVHRVQDNPNGQPCDLIAAKDGRAYLIDCKVCKGDAFYLDRMEDNQLSAMEAFRSAGNSTGIFAVLFEDTGQIRLFQYSRLRRKRKDGKRKISSSESAAEGVLLEDWLVMHNAEKKVEKT